MLSNLITVNTIIIITKFCSGIILILQSSLRDDLNSRAAYSVLRNFKPKELKCRLVMKTNLGRRTYIRILYTHRTWAEFCYLFNKFACDLKRTTAKSRVSTPTLGNFDANLTWLITLNILSRKHCAAKPYIAYN